VLLNANDEILKYILEEFYEFVCGGSIGSGNFDAF